jgi:CRISPR system Cascade subunit CasC
MFLQIHTLTSYHATLLNRDDAGLAKRVPFGDAIRLRVSSQCLKRHWREYFQTELKVPGAFRTRHFFDRIILPRLCEQGMNEHDARVLTQITRESLIKTKDKKKEKQTTASDDDDNDMQEVAEDTLESRTTEKDTSSDALSLSQAVLFGKPEADYLVKLALDSAKGNDIKEAAKDLKERLNQNRQNFKSMLRQGGYESLQVGFEGAMFGRFVTSDVLSRVDAAVHVAHSFTVHGLDTEVDYFTVVDDLNREEETGAAHANDMELGAGVFYGYVVVDVPLLISNTTGCDREKWTEQDPSVVLSMLRTLLKAMTTASPGAKHGSTAPYSYSDFVLLESGKKQPRTLANAYLKAIPQRGDLLQESVNELSNQMTSIDRMYGEVASFRSVATTKNWTNDSVTLSGSMAECGDQVLGHIFDRNGHGDTRT